MGEFFKKYNDILEFMTIAGCIIIVPIICAILSERL